MEEKKNSFRFPTNRKTVKTGGFLFGGKPKEEEKPTESVVSVPASASVDPAPERDSKMRLPAAPSPKENVMEDIESLNPPIQKSQKIVGLDYTPSQAPPVSLRERLKQYQDLKGSKNDLPVGPDREKELERQMDASKLDSWAGPPAQLLNSAPPPAVEWSAPELPTKSPPKIPQPPSGSSSDGANEKSWVPASPREIAHTDEKSSPLNDDEESAHANDKSWLPASLRPPLNDDQEFDPLKNDVSEEPSESWVPQNNLEGEETEEEVIDDEFDEVTAASIVSAEDYEEEVFDGEEEVLEEYEENEQTGEWEEAPLEGEEGEDPEEEHEVLDDESEAQEFTEITDEQELVEDEEEEEIELVAEGEESSDPEVSTMDEGGLPDEEEYSEERSHPEVSPMDQGGLSDEEDNGYIPLRSTISNDGDDVPDDVLDDVLDESQGLFDMIDDDDYPVNESFSKTSESEEVDETGGWVPVPADKEANVEPQPQAAPTSGRSNRAAVAPVSRGAPSEDPEDKAPFEEKSDGSEEKIDYGKRSYRLLIWGIVVIGILAILAILLPFLINDDDKVIINNVSPTPGPSSLRGPTFATATPEPTFVGQTPAPNPAPMEETLAPAVTSAPTAVPTQSPSTQRLGQFIRRFLVPILGEEVFQDPLSLQYVTAAFMADEDAYISELNTVGQLADRFGAIIFYLATGGDNWSSCYRNDPDCVTPGQGPWLSGDVCEWFSITCDAEGRITSINFGKFGCSVKCLSWPLDCVFSPITYFSKFSSFLSL
jgi:hypothetical protein